MELEFQELPCAQAICFKGGRPSFKYLVGKLKLVVSFPQNFFVILANKCFFLETYQQARQFISGYKSLA